MEPRTGSATERRELRRSIRNVLGTSRDDAPTVRHAIYAASHVKRLLELASGDRFTLAIIDQRRGTMVPAATALAVARGEQD